MLIIIKENHRTEANDLRLLGSPPDLVRRLSLAMAGTLYSIRFFFPADKKSPPKRAEAKRRLLFDRLEDGKAAHELTEGLRDDNRAIRLLELLKDRREDAGSGEARPVERVAELNFAFGVAIADHSTASLIVAGVGDGRDFLVDVHGRDPDFDVVGPGHGMGAVAGGKLVDLVAKAESFDKFLGLLDHLFEGGVAAFFGGVLDHFHFVELIAADHAPLFSAVGAGFLAVAGGVGEIFPREIIEIEDLVAVEVHQSGFGGG